MVYLAGFSLGGRLPLVLSTAGETRAVDFSTVTARATALAPLLLALVPAGGALPVWVAVLAGGYVTGSLEASARQARTCAVAARPGHAAVPLSRTGPAVLRITGWPVAVGSDRWRAPARLLHLERTDSGPDDPPGAPGQGVMLTGPGEPPCPGELITGNLEIFTPRVGSLPGSFDYRLFLAGRDLLWRGRLSAWESLPWRDPVAWLGRKFLLPLRRALVGRIHRRLPPAEAGLADAVLLGIRTGDSRRTSRPFADLGLAHLFAVSGLHVGVLLGIFLLPATWGGFPPWLKLGPLVVLLPVYVLLTGMPGSVVRAASLAFLALLAGALGKPAQPLRLIGLLFWAGTIWNPRQNLDTGLQLSYLAAGGILAASHFTNGFKFSSRRVLGPVCMGLAVSCAAQWFTLPLVAASFGRISLLSPLANLVAVPVFGLAVWCVVLALALGGIWTAGAEAAAALGWLLLRAMSGLASLLARWSSGFPLGCPYPGLGQLIIWLVLTAAAIVVLELYRTSMLSGRRVLGLVLVIILTGLGVFGPLAWTLRAPGGVTAWQFDVAQGDCCLLVFPDGWNLLIDTGGRFGFTGENNDGPLTRTVLPFLQRNGCRHLDAVILTHGHLDHTGGAAALGESLPVERWYVSGRAGRALAGKIDSTLIERPVAGRVLHRWREWEVEVVYPPGPLSAKMEENDRSLAIVLRRAGQDVALWGGDMELAGERVLLTSGNAPRDVQIWKAGHHGSNTSGSAELLQRLHPALILISCGIGNHYGHPNHGPYVLGTDTLATVRTDLQGSILMQWDKGGGLTWRAMRDGPRKITAP